MFFNHGARSEPVSIVPQIYVDLKSVSHIPFSLYLILDPFSQKRTTQFPTAQLQDFKRDLDRIQDILVPRFQVKKNEF